MHPTPTNHSPTTRRPTHYSVHSSAAVSTAVKRYYHTVAQQGNTSTYGGKPVPKIGPTPIARNVRNDPLIRHAPSTYTPPTDPSTTAVKQCSSTSGNVRIREKHLVGFGVMRPRSLVKDAGMFVFVTNPSDVGDRKRPVTYQAPSTHLSSTG